MQKFIFTDVFSVGNLDLKTRKLIMVAILFVQQILLQVKTYVSVALNVGVTLVEAREVIRQQVSFIGFFKTLNIVTTMNDLFTQQGIK